MPPRVVLVLCLLLPFLARAAPHEGGARLPALEVVRVGSELELTFKRLPPEPALRLFSVEEARAFVVVLEEAFQAPHSGSNHQARLPACVVTATSTTRCPPVKTQPSELERRVRAGLYDAVAACQTRDECKRKLIIALDEIAGDICEPGSRLNKLLTKKP